jgi:virulence factor Mce family protein
MKPLRERNQVMVAIVGTALAAAVVLLSLNLAKLPFLHPSHSYYADFANADGLKSGDDVRVEGITVGSVQSVDVQGDHVHVAFTVQAGLKLGDTSHASVEVATVLGNLFMQVESSGSGQLHPGATIPVSRTVVPYTLLGALNTFGEFSQKTDLPTLRNSLQTLAQTLDGISPKDATAALDGLASIAQTVAAKESEINDILTTATSITGTLNNNSGALVAMLTQGDEFLRLVEQRHDVIAQLLTDTAKLGQQLRVTMARNGTQLAALLANLDKVTTVLAKEKTQLQQAVVNLGQFSVNITNATGTGPWADLLLPEAVTPDNIIAGCGAKVASQKKPCQ